jgi:hypothetical protein
MRHQLRAATAAVVLAVASPFPEGALTAQNRTIRDSANIRIIENALPSVTTSLPLRLVPSPILVLGGPTAKGGQGLGRVNGAARLSDGGVVISDFEKMGLFLFDPSGQLRSHLDNLGVAGQTEPPWGMLHAGIDTILMWDGVANRLTTVNRTGKVIRVDHIENPPDERSSTGGHRRQALQLVGVFPAGERLGWTKNTMGMASQGVEPDSSTVIRISAAGKLTEIGRVLRTERFRYRGQKYGATGDLPFGRVGSIAVGNATWFYTDGSSFEIQRRAPSGRLEAFIRLNRRREPVTVEAIKRFGVARLARTDPILRPEYQLALHWLQYPTSKPAYTALKVDRSGNLWARLWSNDDEAAAWDVFDPNGDYLCAIDVPPDLDVIEIGEDYLLARYTRVFGVEEVREYRLMRRGK